MSDEVEASELMFFKTCTKRNASCFQKNDAIQCGDWNEDSIDKDSCD